MPRQEEERRRKAMSETVPVYNLPSIEEMERYVEEYILIRKGEKVMINIIPSLTEIEKLSTAYLYARHWMRENHE